MGNPLKSRLGDEVFTSIRNWVECTLKTCDHTQRHYYADGGEELIDQGIKKFLLDEYRTTVTWSSTDTLELNAVSKRKFRLLGEMTLSMLAGSGLLKSFWWNAYVTACDITRMLPTRTHKSWMSPKKCVPGWQTPNLSKLRR